MELSEALESIRTKYALPALAACAVVEGKPTRAVAVGFRKLGTADPVLPTDAFQLGSDTKAMTATLAGMLIDDDKLRWTTTLGELFDFVPAPWKSVTVADLIYQTGGLSVELGPKGMDYNDIYRWKSTERAAWLKARLQSDSPGKREFVYSNASYAALGLVCERVTGKSWESLIRKRLWRPLGISGGGFGAPPKVWQHRTEGKKLVPVDPRENADNPAIMAPAGAAWLPLGEWARFAAFHATGSPALLKPETLAKLHTAPAGSDYAGAWIVAKGQPWAGGDALTHTGSNTMNMAVVWIAPKKRLAVLAATNAAPDDAGKALNDAVLATLKTYRTRPATQAASPSESGGSAGRR